MTTKLMQIKLDELFTVKSGDFHAINELDTGDMPLVSCGDTNNGVVGFFNIPEDCVYKNTITVAYNGQPLTTKFHPYLFGAKDDVAVLLPRLQIRETTLLYTAALLNKLQWRYSYGRKCYREKLRNVTLSLPSLSVDGRQMIDEDVIAKLCPSDYSVFIPQWLKGFSRQVTQ